MRVRHAWWLAPRRTVAAAVGVVVLSFWTISRAFSVSCPRGSDCVTLGELRDGAALPEALHIYDREGNALAEVAGPLRRALAQEDIPKFLADAFVAVEDRRFWQHEGVDTRGILRAALSNMRQGELAEGASTIPMQLVRTLWSESLRGAGPWRRKIIEARIAPRLIEDLGHEQVLTLYLNAIYLGSGVYGVEQAARHYFGVGVAELSLGQIATLVGITPSPESYEPIGHPERARAVRNFVLATLAEEGLITGREADQAAEKDLELAPSAEASATLSRRTHLTAAITRELRRVAPDLAGRPGLHLHTTIDSEMQAEGERVLAEQLAAIEAGEYGPFEDADSEAPLEGAAVALDATSGAVRAWIGGRDFVRSEFDRVEQARRQVGSLVKPFLVALAIEQGYGIVDVVSADTIPIDIDEGTWLPADHVAETSLPLREALVLSSNRAAAHLGVALGPREVARTVEQAGVGGPVPAFPSSSIGAFDASLLEMTSAYAVFGNRGARVEPHLLEQVEDPEGTVVWARADTARAARIMDARTAFVVLDAMQAVVERGTGYPVRAAGYAGPAAGKTGTTNEGRDAWFIGLTPGVAAGVWVGFDRPREIVTGSGGSALAAPVWGRWMRRATDATRISSGWAPPAGVEYVRYDPVTGQVLAESCGGRRGIDYHEAWVTAGEYDEMLCREGVGGWLGRVFRVFVPRSSRPLEPLGPRRRR